jgi:hypothetical protein
MRWATITGGVLEFVGGVILVWQLGLIRTVETDANPWLLESTRGAANRVRATFGRRKDTTIEATADGVLGFSASANATVGAPTPPPPSNPTMTQLIGWMQTRLDSMNELLEQGRRTTKQELDETFTAQNRLMRELLGEMKQADLTRRVQRGRSGNWQALATLLILVGVVLTTLGGAS